MPNAAKSSELLSLTEAATLLGVHPATLRRWADQGDILVMVTPGGHRRFPRTEIDRLRGVSAHAEDDAAFAQHLVDQALAHTRVQLEAQHDAAWVTGFDASERDAKRESGRRLMQLLRQLLAADDDEQGPILDEVRALGQTYADDAHRSNMGLTDTLRAVTFFRDQILESTLAGPDAMPMDQEAGRRAIQRINAFFSAILLAVAAAFD
ncbi:MAG: helix-turn-helix domain-containing protein [Rhodothermaceae bacterium]|nr:helix-turn-helix domain-containing protein [Rhodothermaceae bacterium]